MTQVLLRVGVAKKTGLPAPLAPRRRGRAQHFPAHSTPRHRGSITDQCGQEVVRESFSHTASTHRVKTYSLHGRQRTLGPSSPLAQFTQRAEVLCWNRQKKRSLSPPGSTLPWRSGVAQTSCLPIAPRYRHGDFSQGERQALITDNDEACPKGIHLIGSECEKVEG